MTPTPLDDRREYSDDDGCARIEVEVFKGGVHIVLGRRRIAGSSPCGRREHNVMSHRPTTKSACQSRLAAAGLAPRALDREQARAIPAQPARRRGLRRLAGPAHGTPAALPPRRPDRD